MRTVLWFIRHKPLGVLGAAILLLWLVVAVCAPLITTHSPTINQFKPNQAPSGQNWLGTDRYGRDVFSRVVHGSRISIFVGLSTIAIALVLSLAIGLTTSYVGGAADLLTQRVVDVVMSFPGMLLALLLSAVLGQGLFNVILAISVGNTIGGIRLVRSAVLSEREKDYVLAARVVGCSRLRICFRHISPNIIPMAMVAAASGVGGAILAEAGMSFLGLGVPPPTPTWGMDLSEARSYFTTAPWLALYPGLALTSTVFAFNVVGDALRDTLDPRLRRARAA